MYSISPKAFDWQLPKVSGNMIAVLWSLLANKHKHETFYLVKQSLVEMNWPFQLASKSINGNSHSMAVLCESHWSYGGIIKRRWLIVW